MRDSLPAAVLLGYGVPAVDIARSLGRRGIPVIGVDWKPSWAERSRYITRTAHPPRRSDEALLQTLERIARAEREAPLLLPLHDDYVLFLSRYRERLARAYRFVLPEAALVQALVSKRGLWNLCSRNGVAMPQTYFPGADESPQRLAARVTYPCLVKPDFSRDWVRSRLPILEEAQKVITAASRAELTRVCDRLGAALRQVVVQEVIPGPERDLYYLAVYLNRDGQPLATFVGRKLRTLPPHFGNGTYVQSVHAPEVVRLGVKLLQSLGYRGCGGVEFKLDPRDGVLKLIEVNVRFGLWDGFGAACGVDLAYAAYADAMGWPVRYCDSYRANLRWAQPDRDFWTMLDYRRRGEISIARWLLSLARCRVLAPAALDDPAPWAALNALFVRRVLQAAGRRLLR